MSKYLLCSAALAALLTALSADAADLTPSWGPAPYNWSGFYACAVAGAAWGQYDPRTATVDDGYLDAANAAAVTAAGAQSIKTNGFVTGIEGGYNFQTGRWLLGLEADLEAVQWRRSISGVSASGGKASRGPCFHRLLLCPERLAADGSAAIRLCRSQQLAFLCHRRRRGDAPPLRYFFHR